MPTKQKCLWPTRILMQPWIWGLWFVYCDPVYAGWVTHDVDCRMLQGRFIPIPLVAVYIAWADCYFHPTPRRLRLQQDVASKTLGKVLPTCPILLHLTLLPNPFGGETSHQKLEVEDDPHKVSTVIDRVWVRVPIRLEDGDFSRSFYEMIYTSNTVSDYISEVSISNLEADYLITVFIQPYRRIRDTQNFAVWIVLNNYVY